MTNALHAAMTLRSLHQDDRNWILSKLSTSEKEAIRDVANQVDAPTPISELGFELAVAREERNALPEPQIAARLNALDPLKIAGTLELEPDWVIALILGSHRWSWQNAVLEQLGPERKNRISRITFTPLPHRLIESILNSLCARAFAVQDHSPPTQFTTPITRSKWAAIHRKLHGFIAWAF